MFTNSNILVPTDFSPYARFANTYALAIARNYGGTVHFVHVLDANVVSGVRGHGMWLNPSDAETLLDSMREHASSRLTTLAEEAEGQGVRSEQHIVVGNAPQEILRLALDKQCTLIVIATHGRSGFDHVVFGSVAERVVRQSPVPVLAIKHPEHDFVEASDLSLRIRHVLFPTDFSDFSEKGLPFAISFCREFSAKLSLLHATEIPIVLPEFMPDSVVSVGPEMEQAARGTLEEKKAGIPNLDVDAVSVTGVPHSEICRFAEEHGVDLIVMPTHGRSGFGHVLFGSVAEKVVRLARCPVLTIRPDGDGSAFER
ncbi:MAG: universal stress protein [Candidatus Hydrogenedentes bacterium]|nr:universal stress protein [Candidatus Hydrogenedentota bacterium]